MHCAKLINTAMHKIKLLLQKWCRSQWHTDLERFIARHQPKTTADLELLERRYNQRLAQGSRIL